MNPRKKLEILKGSFESGIIDKEQYEKEKEKIEVNSHHHQGITEEQLGKDLDILTFYNDAVHGPIIESTICGPKKIAFVQWHPKILWGLN